MPDGFTFEEPRKTVSCVVFAETIVNMHERYQLTNGPLDGNQDAILNGDDEVRQTSALFILFPSVPKPIQSTEIFELTGAFRNEHWRARHTGMTSIIGNLSVAMANAR